MAPTVPEKAGPADPHYPRPVHPPRLGAERRRYSLSLRHCLRRLKRAVRRSTGRLADNRHRVRLMTLDLALWSAMIALSRLARFRLLRAT